jgi:hypothetical protein
LQGVFQKSFDRPWREPGQVTHMNLHSNRSGSNRFNQWFHRQQLRALQEAYSGAREIKALEDQYFGGEKITQTPNQSKTVYDYVRSLRDRQLLRVRLNLAQFRLNSFLSNRRPAKPIVDTVSVSSDGNTAPLPAQPPNGSTAPAVEVDILEKLNFIDTVIRKYRESDEDEIVQGILNSESASATSISPTIDGVKGANRSSVHPSKDVTHNDSARIVDPATISTHSSYIKHKSGFFQGGFSIGLGRDFDPNYEQKVVQEIRIRRKQDRLALRWLAILIFVPLLIQTLSRNLVFEPILGNYSDRNPTRVELNNEIETEFLAEFSQFKEELEIREILGLAPSLSPSERQEQLQERAAELWREARERELNGFKNVLSDGVALFGFAGLVFFNRNKLASLKTFSNRTFLGLSDPAKVFLFILITDMFVGFHSAEGWAVLLEGVASHFGLPESRVAINTFIATVPVILDSCIKFWIFTYLTRVSPSASAIYERMNT